MISQDNLKIGNELPFVLIAGPCVIENEQHCMKIALELKRICDQNKIKLIFKSSFDKANRSSIDSYRGPGLRKGLEILKKIKSVISCPITTDVHETNQIIKVSEVVDIIQIPAFLCRQTDLIINASNTNKIINIKKGQFISPKEIKNIVAKAKSTDNDKIMITERGTSFGYNNLVVDFRNLDIIKSLGVPVVFDATHSVQLPGYGPKISMGKSEFIESLARAAISIGISALFMEIHDNPKQALCDKDCQYNLSNLEAFLRKIRELDLSLKKLRKNY